MKILHTADWHLGQRLLQNDRSEEFRLALDWLLHTIQAEAVDVLLVAGDIFDIGNPPNQARQLYYNFLKRLLTVGCRHVVITGGNHDSPAMLNAPRELLQALNIHIVGAATADLADELIVLRAADGGVAAVVAAVPFLRDRDLRTSTMGESERDRQSRLQEGLTQHYRELAELARAHAEQDVPILAMGHLYAKGAVAADKQDNIYVGNRENMEAEQFPDIFHYVALGHIHRAQRVGEAEHIRYSGSLIPLSFSETADQKIVYIVEFAGAQLRDIRPLEVPVFRRLKTIQGSLEKVQESLERFAAKPDRLLTPWVEAIIDTEQYVPQLDQVLRTFAEKMPLELVKIKINRPYQDLAMSALEVPELEYLEVEEVFLRKCRSEGELSEAAIEQLLLTFRELQDWMNQRQA
ncbi:MAG: exonuclease subunit SbcD [Bacteroidetes bacterium]|nr:MAG: exonuclease subunit SbcD [Bacteroidota bacterium]